jgi:hypothetical protein
MELTGRLISASGRPITGPAEAKKAATNRGVANNTVYP